MRKYYVSKAYWKKSRKKKMCIRDSGLGARDTLRLEMGFCLYGNDLDLSLIHIQMCIRDRNNLEELQNELLDKGCHFSEMSSGQINQTELISLLISQGKTFVEGVEIVFEKIKGSCSMLILTEEGIIAARDKWGRTPILIGKKEGAYAASSEPCSFPNLGYEIDYNVGPGEMCIRDRGKATG